ncbi:MAG: hypothetical protein IPP44_26325 [Ideonella sp.]|nr:hypothetical protein [Ideonella sp.]
MKAHSILAEMGPLMLEDAPLKRCPPGIDDLALQHGKRAGDDEIEHSAATERPGHPRQRGCKHYLAADVEMFPQESAISTRSQAERDAQPMPWQFLHRLLAGKLHETCFN